MKNQEIERKFLIDRFPEDLTLLEEAVVWQGYISADPVVRIRKKVTTDGSSYRLCFKSKGTLVRKEIELELTAEKFDALAELLPIPPVRKDYKVFALADGLRLECSLVDAGAPESFYYAEVEFESEEQALAFAPLPFLGEEKTQEPAFTMSRYWQAKVAKVQGG